MLMLFQTFGHKITRQWMCEHRDSGLAQPHLGFGRVESDNKLALDDLLSTREIIQIWSTERCNTLLLPLVVALRSVREQMLPNFNPSVCFLPPSPGSVLPNYRANKGRQHKGHLIQEYVMWGIQYTSTVLGTLHGTKLNRSPSCLRTRLSCWPFHYRKSE
jgi:hypothetical protein